MMYPVCSIIPTATCISIRGAGTILYVGGGPTNQNKCYGKSGGGGNTYIL